MNDKNKELLQKHLEHLLERARLSLTAEDSVRLTECALKVYVVLNTADESFPDLNGSFIS